jgi:hypothetical protein
MSIFDRPFHQRERERERERGGPGRRFGRRASEEAERGPWGARDPAEFERRHRGRDPYEDFQSDDEGGGYGEQGFEPSRRRFEPGWDEPGVYGGTPSQQRGWERRGFYRGEPGGFGERYPEGGFEQRGYGRGGAPQQRGRFAGRGPKGYQRTDERVREDVCDCLMADPDIDASEIIVVVAEGEVTLDGSVPDRQTKRAAEESVEDISGVRQVHNRLRVESKSDFERGTTGAGSHSEAGASEGQRSTTSRRPGT